MTTYKFIQENINIIDMLANKGFITSLTLNYKSIYEDVMNEQQKGSIPTDSYWDVAEKMKVSINTVIRAVVAMTTPMK
jgi:hypothetical protein